MLRKLKETLDALPPEWPEDLLPKIRMVHDQHPGSIVVLDDDLTGSQTVYNVPVLTDWSPENIYREFERKTALFCILTNSRSMSPNAARIVAQEIGERLLKASDETGHRFSVISRSDSTLRGHYPGEVDALIKALNQNDAVQVIAPFYLEGGCYTIDDIHWVAEGEYLVPVADTSFAGDPLFGYQSSNLKEWILEKSQGNILSTYIKSLTIENIRQGGPDLVADELKQAQAGDKYVINAASMRDLEVVALGLLAARQAGQRFIYRTANSFIRAFAGLRAHPLLTMDELPLSASGGALIVVGSHIPISTQQLTHLVENSDVESIEIEVERLLSETQRIATIKLIAERAEDALKANKNVVLFTSRDLITDDEAKTGLEIVNEVSSGVVAIVRAIRTRPRYLLAKGGITASDILTKSFHAKRTLVLGQILPGVPVYQLGEDTPWPGMTYIVFPGNFGGIAAMTDIVRQLTS